VNTRESLQLEVAVETRMNLSSPVVARDHRESARIR
jgi:hypothetical protein